MEGFYDPFMNDDGIYEDFCHDDVFETQSAESNEEHKSMEWLQTGRTHAFTASSLFASDERLLEDPYASQSDMNCSNDDRYLLTVHSHEEKRTQSESLDSHLSRFANSRLRQTESSWNINASLETMDVDSDMACNFSPFGQSSLRRMAAHNRFFQSQKSLLDATSTTLNDTMETDPTGSSSELDLSSDCGKLGKFGASSQSLWEGGSEFECDHWRKDDLCRRR